MAIIREPGARRAAQQEPMFAPASTMQVSVGRTSYVW